MIGTEFVAVKSTCQQYKGPAVVLRRLKGGMLLCKGSNGEEFQETESQIKRALTYALALNARKTIEMQRQAIKNMEAEE